MIGDHANHTIAGNAGMNLKTGNLGTDTFDCRTLSPSLLAGFDRVTDAASASAISRRR